VKTATTTDDLRTEVYSQIEAHLWQERERIYAEIHAYPPPIPACDAQFNYLIEKRALVTQELSQVRAICTLPDSPERNAAALRQLVKTSEILSKSVKVHLLEALAQ